MTSFLFPDAKFSLQRLKRISSVVGKDKLVVDVRYEQDRSFGSRSQSLYDSCRRRGDKWFVAMNKWQDITDMEVSKGMRTRFYL